MTTPQNTFPIILTSTLPRHSAPLSFETQKKLSEPIKTKDFVMQSSASSQMIAQVKEISSQLQKSPAFDTFRSTSVLQQFLNTFSQFAIVILTSTVKAPNFYYILKLTASMYFIQVSEWQEQSETIYT